MPESPARLQSVESTIQQLQTAESAHSTQQAAIISKLDSLDKLLRTLVVNSQTNVLRTRDDPALDISSSGSGSKRPKFTLKHKFARVVERSMRRDSPGRTKTLTPKFMSTVRQFPPAISGNANTSFFSNASASGAILSSGVEEEEGSSSYVLPPLPAAVVT